LKTGIQTRLLLVTALVLGTFLFLAGLVLERSFRASVLAGAEEQLRLVTFSLMGALERRDREFVASEMLPEPRLAQPASGLYAWVTDASDSVRWRSPSSRSLDLAELSGPTDTEAAPDADVNALPPLPDTPPPESRAAREDGSRKVRRERARGVEGDRVALAAGQFDFHTHASGAYPLLHLRYAVIWEDLEDTVLTFHVAAARAPFDAVIQDFRRNLRIGLVAVTALFVLFQFLAVRWGLRPLRTMAQQVRELEEGRRHRLDADYPRELTGLVANVDRFVAHEEARRRRYHKAMEDLAHSLKTPLAVMRNAMEQVPPRTRGLLEEQLDRIQSTVTHQLTRSAASGPEVVGRSESLARIVQRLVRALQTAYRERSIHVEVDVPAGLRVRGDERDLMEMLGNVLENAFKYTHSAIRVSASRATRLRVTIDDDGPGLAPALRAEVLNRGTRADEVQSGQGIGLAVVAELVQLYRGQLILEDSDLGGLRVRIDLP
jgi:two-component system sensor histidine kinase PhoQ